MTKFGFIHGLAKAVFAVANVFKPTQVTGRENIPEGPAVICSNHVYMSDPFHIVTKFSGKDRIWIMAKEEILHWPVVGRLLNYFEFIIWVKRGKADVGAVKSALKALKGGEKLLIFPEGTRNEEMGEGKTGAAMLAIRSGVPILPVHVSRERGAFTPVKITIGAPYLPFTESRKATAEDYQRVTDELMERIRTLGGEEEEAA